MDAGDTRGTHLLASGGGPAKQMRVVQTVFGVFHHFELARQLEQRGHLERIFSTWPWTRLKREGLPRARVATFPWIHGPEMLLRRFGADPAWLLDPAGYSNALLFDAWTNRAIERGAAPDALVGISGSSLVTGRSVQRRGGRFVCDRGSSHQRFQDRVVSEEFRRWGVNRAVTDPRDTRREMAIYDIADAITVPSSFAARSFVEEGVPREKVHVIPYGVRLEHFSRVGEPPTDRFEVLFVGSVGLRKGVPYLLEAFARLRCGEKRLRMVGSISPEMRGVLGQLPKEHVEFLGPLPQDRLPMLMSTSHVMVLPSIEEGLALVQGQALACGCPVIATTNTGAEDLFTDRLEGFILPVRRSDLLTEAMQQIYDDPELRQRMSQAALGRVDALGGWDTYGQRWEDLLGRLTSASSTVDPPPTK